MTDELTADRLADVGFFAGLSSEELAEVAALARVRQAPVGAVLTEEGGLAMQFFVLLAGHVTVHRAGHHVTDLGPGDVFGEAGAVQLQPRNATVIATTPAELASLMGWELRDLVERSPVVKARIDDIVAGRTAAS